jgi:hypothetical protein
MTFAHAAIFVAATHQRSAFLILCALVIGAGIPLAFAWARLIPEDAPPFKIEPGSYPSVDFEPVAPTTRSKRDLLSASLLLCITLTYLVRFPGMPLATIVGLLATITSHSTVGALVVTARIVLLVGSGLAACIAATRPGRLRVPVIAAAGLTLLLWLLGPILQAAVNS